MTTVVSAAKRTRAGRNASPAVRNPDRALQRLAVVWFAAFLLCALWGLVATTLSLVHVRMSGGTLPDIAFFQFALMLNAIAAFVVLYGLAIYYRRQPLQHERYMGCTVFPLFTPITDRLIYAHWPSLTSLVPRSTASRSCSCSASRWRTACCWLS